MAKNFMSNILDELMGRDRDALPTDKPRTYRWDDSAVCSHYLVCFCPNELFVNTKADLGPCAKVHDDQLRKKYQEEANAQMKSVYEADFIRFAEKMISDIEAKIKRGKMRIALANGPDGGTYAGPGSKNAEKIALLTDRINVLLSEAEAAGCDGDVEKAQGLMKLCDQLKEEREQLKSNEVEFKWNPDKAMQVCEVCGSYLIIGEAQHRLDDHIMGKQHVGFAMLRKNMEDIKKAREIRDKEEREKMEREWEQKRVARELARDKERGRERDKSRRDERKGRRSRSRSQQRHNSKSKDRKKRSRSRDRKDKDTDRKRDSSKDRKSKHSSSRKRDKRSRSRSKDKDKHKRKRSRSRSRDRKEKESRKRDKEDHRDRDRKDEKTRSKHSSPRDESPKPRSSHSSSETKPSKSQSPKGSWEICSPPSIKSHKNGESTDEYNSRPTAEEEESA